jgi:hypothetical protein
LYRNVVNHGHKLNSKQPEKTESLPITKHEKAVLIGFFKVHKAATTINSGISDYFRSSDSNIKENIETIDLFWKDLINIKSANNLRTGEIDHYIKTLKQYKTSFTTKISLHDYKEQLLSGQKAQIETIKTELRVSGNSSHSHNYTESFREIYELSRQSSDLKSAITEKLNSTEKSLRNTKYDRPEEIDTLLNLSELDVSNEKISIYLDGGTKTFTIQEALNKIKTNDSKIGQLKIKEQRVKKENNNEGYNEAKEILSKRKKSIITEINKLLNKPNLPPDIKAKLTDISEELNPQSKPESISVKKNPWDIFNIFTQQEEPAPAPIKAVSPGYNHVVNIKYNLDNLDDLISKSYTPKQNKIRVDTTTNHILSLINDLEKQIDSQETLSKASTVSKATSRASSTASSTASSKNLPKSPQQQDFFGNLFKTKEIFNALNPLTILGNFYQEKPPQNNPRQNLGTLSHTNNQKPRSHTPSNLNKPFIQINIPSNVRPSTPKAKPKVKAYGR